MADVDRKGRVHRAANGALLMASIEAADSLDDTKD